MGGKQSKDEEFNKTKTNKLDPKEDKAHKLNEGELEYKSDNEKLDDEESKDEGHDDEEPDLWKNLQNVPTIADLLLESVSNSDKLSNETGFVFIDLKIHFYII